MNILLLAMPDTISALDPLMSTPNLGLCSIAGNLEGHRVRVADLAFRRRGLARRVEGLLEGGGEAVRRIPGLSFRQGGYFAHNPPSGLADLKALKRPDRGGRLLGEGRLMGLAFDCAETSRGCTLGCRFCSITRMYGKAIRLFPLERVLEDLRRLKARGTIFASRHRW